MPMSFAVFLAIYYYLDNGKYPEDCSARKDKQRLHYQASKLFIDGGRLLEKTTNREVLHEGNAWHIVRAVHEEGHLGINNTMKKLLRGFVCSEAKSLVTEVVKNCSTCQYRARPKQVRSNPGYVFKTPRHPFFMVGCDAVGPLQVTSKENRYILTAIDYLTRWPIALAVPDINETTTAAFMYKEIVTPYGVPNYLLTDRGSNFTSTYCHEFLKKLGCKHITTTSYRPNSNGAVERLNQTLCNTLAKLARDDNNIKEWDRYVDSALLALRTMVNSATGHTPGYLLYGYQFQTPVTWKAPREDFVEGEELEAIQERVIMIQGKLKEAREMAREKSDARKLVEKRNYDKRVMFTRRFEIGEKVLLKDMVPISKFSDRWLGPFTVIKINKNGTYHLIGTNSRRLDGAVNGDMLKPFNESARMTPDVTVSRAHEQFQSWVLNKSAVLSVSAVPPKMPTACEGVHEKCYNSAVASVDIT
ncbi:hypothetical protein G6F70_008948 [Rhizopus microsporus]|nr:hypothetical protein G6F71_008861 [Rhizopus microsporus]KAG1194018.1 hypothetical protein G6F70_008948 [Rhizopus microsporus]KAG1206310.1 hypothetical protein G6F69_008928 [Rhizopus microsporus]